MLIETGDWIRLAEAAAISGVLQPVAYRTAHRLGITTRVFGNYIIKKSDIPKISENKLHPGWHWQADPMLAVNAPAKGVEESLKAPALKRPIPPVYGPPVPPGALGTPHRLAHGALEARWLRPPRSPQASSGGVAVLEGIFAPTVLEPRLGVAPPAQQPEPLDRRGLGRVAGPFRVDVVDMGLAGSPAQLAAAGPLAHPLVPRNHGLPDTLPSC